MRASHVLSVLATAMLSFLLGPLIAAEADVAQEIAAAKTAFRAKQQEADERYRAAKDEAERKKIREQQLAISAELSARYVELIQRHPDDKDLFPALFWLADSPVHAERVHELLVLHHLDNPQIGKVCLAITPHETDRAAKLARQIIAKSGSAEARGLAHLPLGQALLAQSRREGLSADARTKLETESRAALQEVIDKYAQVPALRGEAGTAAKAVLFELDRLAVGSPAPELAGVDLDGKAFRLGDYKGKVVLLDFWVHWCAHCMEMTPHNRALVERLKQQPFVLIGVNGDPVDENLAKKNKESQITWRSFQDRGDDPQKPPISDVWNVQAWPTLYLIDHRGLIRAKWVGNPGDEALDKAIDALIAEAQGTK